MLTKDASLGGFWSLLGLGVFYFKRENVSMEQAGQWNKCPNLLFFQCDLKLTLYNGTQGGKASITARLQVWTDVYVWELIAGSITTKAESRTNVMKIVSICTRQFQPMKFLEVTVSKN